MVAQKMIPKGWVDLVQAAQLLNIHPESLLRRKRYGELPPGSYVKVGRSLFFNPQEIPGAVSTDHDGP